jgi:hypothetical protein
MFFMIQMFHAFLDVGASVRTKGAWTDCQYGNQSGFEGPGHIRGGGVSGSLITGALVGGTGGPVGGWVGRRLWSTINHILSDSVHFRWNAQRHTYMFTTYNSGILTHSYNSDKYCVCMSTPETFREVLTYKKGQKLSMLCQLKKKTNTKPPPTQRVVIIQLIPFWKGRRLVAKILCDHKALYEVKRIRKWTEWQSTPHKEKSLYEEFQFITITARNARVLRHLLRWNKYEWRHQDDQRVCGSKRTLSESKWNSLKNVKKYRATIKKYQDTIREYVV